jgi:hypothetical protein
MFQRCNDVLQCARSHSLHWRVCFWSLWFKITADSFVILNDEQSMRLFRILFCNMRWWTRLIQFAFLRWLTIGLMGDKPEQVDFPFCISCPEEWLWCLCLGPCSGATRADVNSRLWTELMILTPPTHSCRFHYISLAGLKPCPRASLFTRFLSLLDPATLSSLWNSDEKLNQLSFCWKKNVD